MATLDQVATQVELIDQRLESKSELDEERRKVDDTRFTVLSEGQRQVLARVDGHGTRQTAIETKWAAFFGPGGGFNAIMARIDDLGISSKDQGKKIDRLTWIVAMGIGGLSVIQFVAEFFIRK